MDASERRHLIDKIVEILSKERRIKIRNILNEFGAATTFPDNKIDKSDYIEIILKREPDELIERVGRHLGIIGGINSTGEIEWKKDHLRVFISHVENDKNKVGEIKKALIESYYTDSFLAHEDIGVSKDWRNEIEKALNSCDGLIAFIGAGFHSSDWTDHEVGIALGIGKPIIPIFVDTKPYGFIEKFQGMTWKEGKSLKENCEELFNRIKKQPHLSKKLIEIAIPQLENAGSFDVPGFFLPLLAETSGLKKKNLSRLRNAYENNSQISKYVKSFKLLNLIFGINGFPQIE